MTLLKIYREWFTALEPEWAIEISEYILKDVFLTSTLFVTTDDTAAYKAIDTIDDFPGYLLKVIDENINARNIISESLLCQRLLAATTYVITKFAADNNEVHNTLLEIKMQNLVLNKLDEADFFGEILNKSIESQSSAQELRLQWKKFSKQYFNLDLIIQQENS